MPEPVTNGQKVIELEMDSGATILVKPLSVIMAIALRSKSETVLPYPDPTPYERKLDDSVTLEPGQVVPASQNPDYVELCKAVDAKRGTWIALESVPLCVVRDDSLIKHFKADLAHKRDMLGDQVPEDEWRATLMYCVISSTQDYDRIISASSGNMIVTEAEIRDGWRIFRRPISRDRFVGRVAKPGTSDSEMAEPQQP